MDLPADIFNGSGGNSYAFGFEYWLDPNNPEDGFILRQSQGQEMLNMGADEMGKELCLDGSRSGRRRFPEEPMVRHNISLLSSLFPFLLLTRNPHPRSQLSSTSR